MIEQLEGRQFLSADVQSGVLTITGTAGNDRIHITQRGAAVIVREGSSITRLHRKKEQINSIKVNALAGDDRININTRVGAAVDAGDGNDWINSGAGNDLLLGGTGNDRIMGNGGNDSISGGAGRDKLFGRAGDDAIDAHDSDGDRLSGGAGNDKARADIPTDKGHNIEEYVTVELVQTAGGKTLRLASFPSGENLLINGAGAVVGAVTANHGQVNFDSGHLSLNNSFGSGLGSTMINAINSGLTLVNAGSSTFTLINAGSQTSSLGAGTLNFAAGSHDIHLAAGTLTLSGGQVYASDLNSARTSLYDAIVIANANAGGATVTLYANSSIGLAKTGGGIVVRPTRIGDLNLDGSVTISDFIDLASTFNSTYAGSGTVNGSISAELGGHIAPGGGVGTLTAGTLTINSGDSLSLDLIVANSSNTLTLAGNTTLNDLSAVASGDYVIIDYSNGGLPADTAAVTEAPAPVLNLSSEEPEPMPM